jgi:lipoate-protein ligase A
MLGETGVNVFSCQGFSNGLKITKAKNRVSELFSKGIGQTRTQSPTSLFQIKLCKVHYCWGVIAVDNREFTNPYINLALEEYLVRNMDCSSGKEYLLLYVNRPCIVLGKNQSIYREVNFSYLRSNDLLLARRVSGGGTVYHDEGNLNFAFISSFHNSKVNNYGYFNSRLIQALKAKGIDAEMDARNNIICNGKKISGGAQFTNRKNIISHGTLLYSADLAVLRSSLRENPFSVQTKAVASVKSSVVNMSDTNTSLTSVSELKKLLLEAYGANDAFTLTNSEWSEVEKLAEEKYASYGWIYGRSPLTTIERETSSIIVEEGAIVDIKSLSIPPAVLRQLKGVPYCFEGIKKALESNPNASVYLNMLF